MGERITWKSFWLVELYGPSHAELLTTGIEELQRRNEELHQHSETARDWLSHSRSWDSGYWNIGYFSRGPGGMASAERIDLPNDFSSLSAEVKQLAPGLTAVVLHFHLRDQAGQSLQHAMEGSLSTEVVPIRGRPGAKSIRRPEEQRERRIAEARKGIRDSGRRWLRERVPGLFEELESETPTWDLVLSDESNLFEAGASPDDQWREVLGYGNLFEQWSSPELPGFLLGVPHNDRPRPTPTITARAEQAERLLRDEQKKSGTSSVNDLVDSAVSDLWVLWAFRNSIEAYGQAFTDIRDQLGAKTSQLGSVRRLKRLREEVMPFSFDLQTIGEAAIDIEATGQPSRTSDADFLPLDFEQKNGSSVDRGTTPLRHSIQERIGERGQAVAGQGKVTAEGLRVQAELLLASTNVRLQWVLLLLTVVIGTASVFATLVGSN